MTSESDPGALLDEGLRALGLDPGAGPRQGLLDLAALLETWAARINLTGHRDRASIVSRLILDALALWQALPRSPEPRRIADLGSGAGFPGLPIALVSPAVEVLLVESRERRHHFQRAAVRALGLERARPIRGRIEEVPPEPCDLVVAQAVAPPEKVLAWMVRWAAPGGLVAIPGTEQPPSLGSHPELSTGGILRYRVPPAGPDRTIWVARRR